MKQRRLLSFSANAVCLAVLWGVFVWAMQVHGQTEAGGGANDDDPGSLLALLRDRGDAQAVAALAKLTRDAQTVKTNMSALLSLARDASGRLDDQESIAKAAVFSGWHEFQTKGEYIVGILSDSIRQLGDMDEQRRVVEEFLGGLGDSVAGKAPAIRPTFALRVGFNAVFERIDTPRLVGAPKMTPARERILSATQEALHHADPQVRDEAAWLLLTAAYMLPSRREKIMNEIALQMGPDKERGLREHLEPWLRNGELAKEEQLAAIRIKSDEAILEWFKSHGASSDVTVAHFRALVSRIKEEPGKIQLLSRVFSSLFYAECYAAGICPEPVPETADDQEKHFVDVVLQFFRSNIVGIDPESKSYRWAIRGLRRMIATDSMALEDYARRHHAGMPKAHGCEQGIAILLEALQCENPDIIGAAASALCDLVWLDAETTRRILPALEQRLASIEKSIPELCPGERIRPDKNSTKWLGEGTNPHSCIRGAIKMAKYALEEWTKPFPKIVAPEPVFDFGQMDSIRQVEHDFVVRNEGTGPMKIFRVSTSRYSKATPQELQVPPGEEAKIHVVYDIEYLQGAAKEDIFVLSDERATPNLRLTLKGTVVPRIAVNPRRLDIGTITDASQPISKKVKLRAMKSDVIFHVSSAILTKQNWPCTTEVKEIESGKRYEVTITFSAGLAPGEYNDILLIEIDEPQNRSIPVPVSMRIEGSTTGK
jgi:hypothetical protein